MHLLLTFDLYTDLLDVPARVAADKEAVRQQFLRWVYKPSNSERYRKKIPRGDGSYMECVCYDGEEFVRWLNRKYLKADEPRAVIIERAVDDAAWETTERIWF